MVKLGAEIPVSGFPKRIYELETGRLEHVWVPDSGLELLQDAGARFDRVCGHHALKQIVIFIQEREQRLVELQGKQSRHEAVVLAAQD